MSNDFPLYTTDYISGVMSLRKPQTQSLKILEEITNAVQLRKGMNLKAALGAVHAMYPICSDFERDFMSLTFALATGVGKTRLMGAFIAYLYTQHHIRNFFVVAPNTTIFEKLKKDLSDNNSAKYVFKGLGCFSTPPQIITDDDYREKTLSLFESDVHIFVYNIDKFNKEGANMKKVNELIGDSFYQALSDLPDLVLIMDESHHYRAEKGAQALNELHPLLGLELTATPLVTKGNKQVPFKNVVYEYPLSKAIEDGYTRTPYAVTRSDIDFYNFGDEQLDKMMLLDGITCHESTKRKLEVYAANHGKPVVKPFMLVVCKDTDHATWVEQFVKSDEFRSGAYRNKTIIVHSKQKGAETEANTRLLLDVENPKNPVEIVIHVNMLKEGWDVNNLYTIVSLRTAASKILREQMVGRGLRLCVNQDGERMDANVLGNDVQSINVLTVIASESYDSFAKGLQTELADAVAGRPVAVTADLFKGKVIVDARGNEQVVDGDTAQAIYFDLIVNGYIDKKGVLTDKYYADKANGTIQVAEEVADSRDSVINILDSVYDSRAMQPENARDKNVELQVDPDKLAMPEFKALWKRISPKSVYVVDFDTNELVDKAIASINRNLHVPKIYFKVETGAMDEIKSKDSLLDGSAFSKSKSSTYDSSKQIRANSSVKYDLIGKLVGETGLTRKAVVAILTGIEKSVFEQFKFNPEEFIIKAAALINDEKATAIIQHITYNVLDEHYDTDIFTEPTIKGKLGTNAMKAQRHLYDHIVYDSTNERDFATDLDTNTDVAVYVKLPDSFYIATPVGHYNPDWAIAFYEGTVKHIYFVAETKGSMSSMQLRLIEESKIHCAREHFKAISNGNVVYDVVDSYQTLLERVMK